MTRALRTVVLLLAALLALGLLASGASWVWVQSALGGRALRDEVLAAAAVSVAGKLQLGELRIDGRRVVLRQLKLFTPEGQLVLEVEAIEAVVDLGALPRRELRLREVVVETPKLFLEEDRRGLNLVRALAAPSGSKRMSPGSTPGLVVEIAGVRVRDGAVIYTRSGERAFAIDGLEAEGHGEAHLNPLRLDGHLEAQATARQPTAGALSLGLSARSPRDDAMLVDVALGWGESRVAGRFAWPELALTELELHATPQLARTVVPGWPLKSPIVVKGDLSPERGRIVLSSGAGEVTVGGVWNLRARTIEALEVEGRALDPSELVPGVKPSRLGFTAKGNVRDARLPSATGELRFSSVWEPAGGGAPLGGLRGQLSAEGGRFAIRHVAGELPGVSFGAEGRASSEVIHLEGQVRASQLGRLAATIEEYVGLRPPLTSGEGTLALVIDGPLTHPGVSADGRLNQLRGPGFSTDTAQLELKLPDVLRPWDTDAKLELRRVTLGALVLDGAVGRLQTQGRNIELSWTTQGLGDLHLSASGHLDAGNQGLSLSALSVGDAAALWALEAPTHLSWNPRAVRLEELILHSGTQRCSLSGELRGAQFEANLRLEGLRLDSLPRMLVPPSLGLSGVLDGVLELVGSPARPEGKVRLTLRDGRVAGLDALRMSVELLAANGRAAGWLSADSPMGTTTGTFDLPLDVSSAASAQPVVLHVEGQALEVGRLAALAHVAAPMSGRVDFTLDVSGRPPSPMVDLSVRAPTLSAALPEGLGGALMSWDGTALHVRTGDDGTLNAEVKTSTLGGTLTAQLWTKLTVAGLRAHFPARSELALLPGRLVFEAEGLDLHRLVDLGFSSDEGLSGVLAVSGALTGPARQPTAEVRLGLARVAVGALRELSAEATLQANQEQVAVALESSLAGAPFLRAEARCAASLEEALASPQRLGTRALAGSGTLLPTALSRFRAAGAGPSARGVAHATFALGGTLDEPVLKGEGAVDDLMVNTVLLGAARVNVQSAAGGTQVLQLALGRPEGGEVHVGGSVGLDLRWPAVRRGLSLGAAPVDLHVEAKGLSVAFLSGVTDLIRTVEGELTAQGRVLGTVGTPSLSGRVQWKGGRLALQGLGEYRDIDLDLSATNEVISLRRLSARSGAGVAAVTGTAHRLLSGALRLQLEGEAERFPVVRDDQLMATVSARLSAEGDLSDGLLELTTVSLPRVEVELPEVKRKDLQDLDRPGDILVLRRSSASRKRAGPRNSAAAAQPVVAKSAWVYRARLAAPRNVWLRSSDLKVELGLSEGFLIDYADELQLSGEATVLRGHLTVIGRDFEVQKGAQVRFAGPPQRPYVDVQALYTHEQDKQTTKVTVAVTGRGSEVAFKVSSDPALPESEIYTLLATGRRELRRNTGAAVTTEQAVSAMGSLAAAALKGMLAKEVPIDVLNLGTTENFQGVGDLKVDVGKYLSDSLFLGFSIQPGARPERGESQYTGRLELQMSRSVSLEAWAGTAPAAGADLVWSREY